MAVVESVSVALLLEGQVAYRWRKRLAMRRLNCLMGICVCVCACVWVGVFHMNAVCGIIKDTMLESAGGGR